MRFLVCNVDTVPCPDEFTQWLSMAEVIDFSALGLTPELILKAYVFGAGSVVTWWAAGFVIAVAVKALSKA